jgi:phycoerythrobilin:ferredoxin oxidoreductase
MLSPTSSMSIFVAWCSALLIQKTESFTPFLTSSSQGFVAQETRLNMASTVGSSGGQGEAESQEDKGGTYRPFAMYAWEKLLSSGLVAENEAPVPDHLAFNSSPSKGGKSPKGTTVNIEVKSAASVEVVEGSSDKILPLRLARYALLETLTPNLNEEGSDEFVSVPNAIQVLNLVLFPDVSLPLPVLGMDLVTLPGGKNLIAIDFQPILPPPQIEIDDMKGDGDDTDPHPPAALFPPQYAQYEERIEKLYEKHVSNQSDILPWGGDIPPQAKRFFSPYALWTRLQGEEAISTIQNEVYNAFCDYFDLYLEIMQDLQSDSSCDASSVGTESKDVIKGGHVDYLNYRRDNDPARPMLTRLYGEDYTEEIIAKVLFKMV